MAFRCDICSKGPVAGKTISHSHKASNRRFMPNLHRVNIILKGRRLKAKVCSRCLRSNKVTKAGPRKLSA